MTLIKVLDALADDQIDDAWVVYHTCFAPLEILAAQAHLMPRDAFDDVMTDPRITKVLVLDDNGGLIGLGTYTTDLTAVPLISWKYYRHHWPDQYDRHAIWYIPFAAFAGDHFGAYYSFVEHIYQLAEPATGIVSMDVCDYNTGSRNFARALAIATRRLSAGVSHHRRVDAQGFFVYDVTGEVLEPLEATA